MELEALAFKPLMAGLSTRLHLDETLAVLGVMVALAAAQTEIHATIYAPTPSFPDKMLALYGYRIVVASPIQDGYDRPKYLPTQHGNTLRTTTWRHPPIAHRKPQAIFFWVI
ncbi:hypothetical protein RB25_17485 [Herbaspirillum rubrisubalbicans]|uniref:Uncharacterized protein n=1 Tax=Herbaspirillum rubrisubalbicans TaxID=80842 RepID=A0ABX9C2B3_9BURK|nr:hypothetical protein [Herbaspirillum rubrisubalbicans]RAM64445.1 hypothetical protein RB24_11480 [Herbaspirillum rubrisubalbicans]RAN45557.1 hypothetical protein RB25_17485 [Herbaspirillum rubrisubalbicans]